MLSAAAFVILGAFATPASGAGPAPDAEQTIHVFVALCDNEHQGIVKVPPKIGNGDDPPNNLYWGTTDGFKSLFSRQKDWKRIECRKPDGGVILERCVFRHKDGAWLVGDAYRGSEIKQCLTDFMAAAAGEESPLLDISHEGKTYRLPVGGRSSFVCYVGHNGLMDFSLPATLPGPNKTADRPVAVLCCKSEEYFADQLRALGTRPLLLTKQFMYPGAFLVKAALDGWLAKESLSQIRDRAARAYAENQKISVKAARGVFAEL